jgi:hypothetical protein
MRVARARRPLSFRAIRPVGRRIGTIEQAIPMLPEHIKRAARFLALLILLIVVWRAPPGDLAGILTKLGPLAPLAACLWTPDNIPNNNATR